MTSSWRIAICLWVHNMSVTILVKSICVPLLSTAGYNANCSSSLLLTIIFIFSQHVSCLLSAMSEHISFLYNPRKYLNNVRAVLHLGLMLLWNRCFSQNGVLKPILSVMAQTKHFSLHIPPPRPSFRHSFSYIVFTIVMLSFSALLLIPFRQFICFCHTLYFIFLSRTPSFSQHFSFPLSSKDRN